MSLTTIVKTLRPLVCALVICKNNMKNKNKRIFKIIHQCNDQLNEYVIH